MTIVLLLSYEASAFSATISNSNTNSSAAHCSVSFPDPETSLTVHLRVTDGSMNKFNTPDA
ncbi:hypothetical protein J1N35_002369 [Gossypium stocksii]|uniref:Uncharacterized protein n=1 Tax=Gossypium stocksii TaxID=47602 RepID=A0A9D3WL59_9ROSI|nr:hypothetical protein J1N35_002369 [Gossypium stocksii]